MNVNEIRYFERKMTDSAFDDVVKYDPAIAVRAKRAWVMKMQGLIPFREYISCLQDITGNARLFWKYQF
jgi:hypothetical protein